LVSFESSKLILWKKLVGCVLRFNDNRPDNDAVLLLLYLTAPGAPLVIAEECSAENNSITVAWQPHPASFIEGFILELDDGSGGRFRVNE